MTTCPVAAAVAAPVQPRRSLGRRLLAAFWRDFRWPVLVSRELVDRAWLDVGLERQGWLPPDAGDQGLPASEHDEVRAAWRTLDALDRTRRM